MSNGVSLCLITAIIFPYRHDTPALPASLFFLPRNSNLTFNTPFIIPPFPPTVREFRVSTSISAPITHVRHTCARFSALSTCFAPLGGNKRGKSRLTETRRHCVFYVLSCANRANCGWGKDTFFGEFKGDILWGIGLGDYDM